MAGVVGAPHTALHAPADGRTRSVPMKLLIEYTVVLASTLAAATLVAFGEPAQADLLMVQAASAEDWLGAVSCLR